MNGSYWFFQVNKMDYSSSQRHKTSWQSVLSTSTAPPCWGKMAITQKCLEQNVKIQKLGLFISGNQCMWPNQQWWCTQIWVISLISQICSTFLWRDEIQTVWNDRQVICISESLACGRTGKNRNNGITLLDLFMDFYEN